MQNEPSHTGTLYVVATPLGNLEDITLRAIRILRESGAIACEDTRRASILLRHLEIQGKKLVSYHNFNEPKAVRQIIGLLEEGTDVALTTDAGTPVISDPGYTILQAVHERGLKVIPVPGPSALTAALSACPLPVSSFYFAGFLPHKKGRKSRIEFLCSLRSSFVLYESPFRIMQLIDDIEERQPDAQIFIAREMTKIHEEYVSGSIAEARAYLAGGKARGEFVVVVHPEGKKTIQPEQQHADNH
ncbi:MAG: 16S rRNA (cytidine(1402)-2'-O)-methyltransferase [Chlorobiaceae bacterium]|nr:16S rRNA (cytidine(1402)-2'-O)-methyltransferase [Chlorobiaceae bacterium]NTW11028.1 16S rRNA (cytidine(1402)-2'-O)-methyltransferase [Chlorobiaceae bacterium]